MYLGWQLEPTDYVFSAIGSNGIVQPGEHVLALTDQGWLDEAVSALCV